MYEQIDGVSMRSCLRPTLANIILTELEIKVVDSLFKDGLLKFHIRYVDDTLALIKESDIDNVLNKLNGFHSSLNFTVDKFDDGVVHYFTVDKFDDGVVHYLDLKLLIMKLIFIIKIHILVNTCTFPVTHPGISK